MRIFTVFFIIFPSLPICGQRIAEPYFLTYGNKRTDADMANAAPTRDGSILAVGTSAAISWDGWDAMLIKIDANGKQIYRKTLGEEDSDDHGMAVTEAPDGRVWVGGYSTRENGAYSAWLMCRTPDGEDLFHKKLASNVEFSAVLDLATLDGEKSIYGAGIKGGLPWFFEADEMGDIKKQETFSSAWSVTGIYAKNIQFLRDGEQWYLYGSGKEQNGETALFFIQYSLGSKPLIKILNNESFSRLANKKAEIVTASHFVLALNGSLLMTGTVKMPVRKEDAFVLTLNKDLNIDKAKLNIPNGRDFDEGVDVLALENEKYIAIGSTRSHKKGANTENIALWDSDEKGNIPEESMKNFGNELAERSVRLIRTADGAIWICGNREKGGALKANRNFTFVKLGKGRNNANDLPSLTTIGLKIIPDETPLEVGTNSTIAIQLFNKGQSIVNGLWIETACTICPAGFNFSRKIYAPALKPGEVKDILIPVWTEANAQPGALAVKVEIKSAAGQSLAREDVPLAIAAQKRAAISMVKYYNIENAGKNVKRGKNELIEFRLSNTGTAVAPKIKISIEVPSGITINGRNVLHFDNWKAGLENTFNISMRVNENFVGQTLAVRVFVDGEGLNGTDYTANLEVTSEEIEKIPLVETTPQPESDAKPNFFVLWQNVDEENAITFSDHFEVNAKVVGNVPISLQNLWLEVNGNEIRFDGKKMDEVKLKGKNDSKNKYHYTLTLPVPLEPGKNLIKLHVKVGNVVEESGELPVQYKAYDKGTLYVISIGVPGGGLEYTQKDASDIALLFQQQRGKLYGEVETRLFTTPDSTTAKTIAETINDLLTEVKRKRLTERDAVLLYISSHGYVSEEDEQYRLQGSDFRPGNEKYTTVSFKEDILDKLERLPCHKFVLVDACHTRRKATGRKGGSIEDETWSSALNTLANSTRSVRIITSCSEGESSYEDKSWENGAFTKVLKDILGSPVSCRSLDKNGDQALSVGELFSTLQRTVQEAVKKVKKSDQTPFAPENVVKEEKGAPFWAF